ncbi:MAG: tripartite tricarboxylate transporter TctB family protein [Treponema sp.]|nr:tripartite tricarboxylate transporter TctB family protein [Treponema sp.]
MALELLFNVILFLFSGFCFWYVGATMPKSADSELGAEQWPQTLLFLLMLAIAFNIYKFFKTHKKEEITAAFVGFFPGVLHFLKSKLFMGMVLLVLLALLYEPLGFLLTSLFFLIGYGILLGERRPRMLIIAAVVITMILYIGFSVFLGVLLPRGYVPFLRNAALFLESIFQWI